MSTLKHTSRSPHHCRGFSLIELMVALVITLILLAGIGQIFLSSKKSFVIQNTLSRIQENGRYAMDVLVSDLRRAGYWGGNADLTTISGTLGPMMGVNEACTNASNWTRMLDRSVYGMDFTGTEMPSDTGNDYSCIQDTGATAFVRGDVVMMRYAHPSAVGSLTKPLPCTAGATIALCYPNEYFLRSSLFRGRLFQGADSEDAVNAMVAPAIRTAELVARAYYIGTSGNASACPAEGAVPSLYRISLTNGAFAAEEVAYGVDNLQIKYGVDSTGDGVVNRYFDADAIAAADWANVIAARVWLLVRAECPETGYTNDNTYAMGDVNYTPADTAGRGYRRKLYTSTIQLRNQR